MAFVSYAQNFEDVMLRRALSQVDRGFYIDVGAQSPDLDSVTRAFSDAGWSGINIEPHPGYFADLLARRPRDVNLNCALGQQSGTATIHLVGTTGLSTLDLAIAGRHSDAGLAIQRAEVEVRTLNHVWDVHVPPGQPVHFLKVDVEGFEKQVILGNDWTKHRPWIVVVEATAPNSQTESFSSWEPFLSDAGYGLVYKDGLNRYYLAREQAHLKEAFAFPPNVFDDFMVAPLVAARSELAQLETSLVQQKALLDRKNVEMKGLSDRVEDLGKDVAERDHMLEMVRGRQKSLQRQLEALQRRHADLQNEFADSTAALTLTQSNLEDVFSRLSKAASDLELARQEIDDLRGELGRVYGSRSWRLTAPLRAAFRHLRRSKGPAAGSE